MDVYVGNLHSATTPAEVQALFEPYGVVTRVYVSPVGFARLEMPDGEAANAAIQSLFGFELHGKQIVVAECSGYQKDALDDDEYEDEDEE